MSIFNSYARRADDAARKIFSEIQEAEAAFKAAQTAKDNGPRPVRGGFQDAQTAAKIARLEADYQEAKAALDEASRHLPKRGEQELQAIRAELVSDLESTFTVDPAKVDSATVELMKSGICGAADFEKLMADADHDSNATMIRLIASYAGKAYETAQESGTRDDKEMARLYAVSRQGQASTTNALLGSFDTVIDAFQRTVKNTYMIDHWEEMTGAIVENF